MGAKMFRVEVEFSPISILIGAVSEHDAANTVREQCSRDGLELDSVCVTEVDESDEDLYESEEYEDRDCCCDDCCGVEFEIEIENSDQEDDSDQEDFDA